MLALLPATALADGKRDLDDGVAFYENLDTERALARLQSAIDSGDLGLDDRAKAYLYIGMVQFELGRKKDADGSLRLCFELSPDISVPEGTSPKTVEAIEVARKKAKASPPTARPPPSKDPKPLPKVEAKPPPPDLTPPGGDGKDEGTNWALWGGVAGGAVAVVAIVVVIVVVAGGSSECEGAGGCATVTFR